MKTISTLAIAAVVVLSVASVLDDFATGTIIQVQLNPAGDNAAAIQQVLDSVKPFGGTCNIPAGVWQVFSPLKNFEPLGKGVIDTYAIACSVLLIGVFIVLAVRRLDSRRLRG